MPAKQIPFNIRMTLRAPEAVIKSLEWTVECGNRYRESLNTQYKVCILHIE